VKRRALSGPLALLAWLLAASVSAQPTLVVHLPSAPIENANRLAAAATAFGAYLERSVPELELEVQLFRRREDAHRFLSENPERVAMVLAEASFFLDAPSVRLVPSYRLVRDARDTYRRVLIVRSNRSDLQSVVDLRGRRLLVVETAGSSLAPFLGQVVFEGELDPRAWFAGLDLATDDFSATAEVLYGQRDAALVSELNPLVQANLGGELRAVFTSPALSLPVLALREGLLDLDQRRALNAALSEIGRSEARETVLAELRFDGIRSLDANPEDRVGLTRLPGRSPKTMEVALPSRSAALPPAAIVSLPDAIGFSVMVPLPEVPPAIELLDEAAVTPPRAPP
jgi:hypothetical protein